ncbi:hypothetical protein O988_05202 [Pseudogymnoascus sp. VKM F-3808]|nr:hypothetical protein O988_05202 [Pseudogymnoascus sp. VKM F-3808]
MAMRSKAEDFKSQSPTTLANADAEATMRNKVKERLESGSRATLVAPTTLAVQPCETKRGDCSKARFSCHVGCASIHHTRAAADDKATRT